MKRQMVFCLLVCLFVGCSDGIDSSTTWQGKEYTKTVRIDEDTSFTISSLPGERYDQYMIRYRSAYANALRQSVAKKQQRYEKENTLLNLQIEEQRLRNETLKNTTTVP